MDSLLQRLLLLSRTDLVVPLSQPDETLWILPEQIIADTIARIGLPYRVSGR